MRCVNPPEEIQQQLNESNDIHIHGTHQQMSTAFANMYNKVCQEMILPIFKDNQKEHRLLKQLLSITT